METLPFDALVAVCASLAQPDVERLLSCSRALRRHHTQDIFYHAIAVERWGAYFWARALNRPTRQMFHSMREELRILHRFETELRKRKLAAWTTSDYHAWWTCEAAVTKRAALRASHERATFRTCDAFGR